MSLSTLLNSDAALTFVGGAVGTAWTFFRSRDWFVRSRKRKYWRAIRSLEAAVERTYRSYVRSIKRSRADGRLTEDEIAQARQMARDEAIAYGRSEGIDVVREIGEGYLDLWLSKLVQKSRRRRA